MPEMETGAKRSTRKTVAPKQRTVDDVRLNERVAIDNLCDWDICFVSMETGKDITIPAGIKNYKGLTVAEVDSQTKDGNVAFCGSDGMGAHASIRILDPVIREYVFQEPVDPLQMTEEVVKKMLAIQNKADFQKTLYDLAATNHEKRMLVRLIEKIGKDDIPSYQIVAIERLTGIKFEY